MPMALYAVAVRSALHEVREALRGVFDRADVVAYVGDTYLLVTVDVIGEALRPFTEVVGHMGLRVHPNKTKIWGPTLDPSALSEGHRV